MLSEGSGPDMPTSFVAGLKIHQILRACGDLELQQWCTSVWCEILWEEVTIRTLKLIRQMVQAVQMPV